MPLLYLDKKKNTGKVWAERKFKKKMYTSLLFYLCHGTQIMEELVTNTTDLETAPVNT